MNLEAVLYRLDSEIGHLRCADGEWHVAANVETALAGSVNDDSDSIPRFERKHLDNIHPVPRQRIDRCRDVRPTALMRAPSMTTAALAVCEPSLTSMIVAPDRTSIDCRDGLDPHPTLRTTTKTATRILMTFML